jgi:hypothetical protein
MNPEEHDELWDLLGKAKQPPVSPFFSRNVLRAIRADKQPERRAPWVAWIACTDWVRGHFGTVSVGVLSAVIACATWLTPPRPIARDAEATADPVDQAAREVVASADFPVIENLDSLLAWEDDDVWLNASVH